MHTFTKTQKLLTKAEFQTVFNKKIRTNSKYFYGYVSPSNFPRIGIIVTKRNHKFAVQRNKIKRIVREYFRIHYADFPKDDIVVIAKHFSKKQITFLWQDLQLLTKQIHEVT